MHKSMNYSESELNAFWQTTLASSYTASVFILPITPYISRYIIENHNCKGTLLDIGCSDGTITSVFDNIGFEVTGIDSDAKRVNEAKSANPDIDFKCFTFKDRLPFEDNSFDVIFSCSVFQYLEHTAVLNECKRVLKKEGSIILIENLKNNPITRSGRAYLKLTRHKYHSYPWNHFTLRNLRELKSEFKYIEVRTFHLFSPIIYLKFLRWLTPLTVKLDSKLLKIASLKHFAWLALFTGKNY